MAIRITTGLANKLAQGYGLRELLRDGRFYVYSGSQPATGDLAPVGTNLIVFTLDGNAYTPPVQSKAKITISGSTGTINTVTVGGLGYNLLSLPVAVTSGSYGLAADALAASINGKDNPLNIVATSDGIDSVTLFTPYWLGAEGNGLTIATTQTSPTVVINAGNSAVFGGTGSPGAGVTAINGLNFEYPAVAGRLSKPSGENWRGVGAADGQAGWFRFVAGGSSVSASGATEVRFDGNISTSGGDINAASLIIQAGAPQTFSRFSVYIPMTEL
jgi:hypothetical protein